MYPVLFSMFSWLLSNTLHSNFRQSMHPLFSWFKFFFNNWIYSMHTLFYMFSWLLSTDPLHHIIRQSVHPLRTRLKLFCIKWSYTVFALHSNTLPLKNN